MILELDDCRYVIDADDDLQWLVLLLNALNGIVAFLLPMPLVSSGVEYGNLRELALSKSMNPGMLSVCSFLFVGNHA
jgi:hypothetical protein